MMQSVCSPQGLDTVWASDETSEKWLHKVIKKQHYFEYHDRLFLAYG